MRDIEVPWRSFHNRRGAATAVRKRRQLQECDGASGGEMDRRYGGGAILHQLDDAEEAAHGVADMAEVEGVIGAINPHGCLGSCRVSKSRHYPVGMISGR